MKQGQLSPAQKKTAAAGGSLALATAALLAILPVWEGYSNTPYRDVVGVMTVCTGETRVQMRTYSDEECARMLKEGVQPFLAAVLKRNPRIQSDPEQWAAHAALAYNIGEAAYSRSSVARLYAAGNEAVACEAIGKFKYAGGKLWKGLVFRRHGDPERYGEIELCRAGLGGVGHGP